MFTFTGKLSRAAALAIAGGSAFLIASAGPAAAVCNYGSPHCAVDPRLNPAVLEERRSPSIDDAGGNGEDPDCQHYGNCLSDNDDDGCWYVDGACQPNAQAPTVRVQPSLRVQPRTVTTLQTRR